MADKITVTRAIKLAKTLQQEIDGYSPNLVSVVAGKGSPGGFADTDSFIKSAKEEFQSINDKIDRMNRIKAALLISNATTVVDVNGKGYTIAQIIQMKQANPQKKLLNSLKRHLSLLNSQYSREMDKYMSGLEQTLKTLPPKEDKDKAVKVYSDNFKPKLEDPQSLSKVIDNIEKEVSAFESEIDILLSISNAKTEIEI
jgi:uncharacterized protein YoxC